MPQFTFEDPGGQRHTIEGPEGATKEQAFQILQQHLGQQAQPETPGLAKSAASGLIQGAGAPGDLSNRVLGGAPAQQPVDKETYYGKLVDALNAARKHLELPTTQQVGGAVGMQPTEPVTPGEKIVQGGASMIPGAVMGGAGNTIGKAMMGAAPAANAVRAMVPSVPQGFGAQMAQNVGRPLTSAITQGAAPTAQGAGDALQNQLLKAGLEHGANALGHAAGIPMLGTGGRALVKMLGMNK